MGKKNIFIIHSSKDKKIGELLYNNLLIMGNNLFDEKSIFYSSKFKNEEDLGENFFELTKEAMQKSDLVIILISKNLYKSFYCLQEMGRHGSSTKRFCQLL